MSIHHQPVMVEEVVALLAPERGGLFADCTVGLGGHAEALLERGGQARLLGLDRDSQALAIAGERLQRFGGRVRLARAKFSELSEVLGGEELQGGILADLGVSSLQLERAERGFSLQREGPLDMRMGGGEGDEQSAFDLVNEAPEGQLHRSSASSGKSGWPAASRRRSPRGASSGR
jgi:16S rRNA (cytosine1402-N4)-methyltransferase